MLRTAAALPDTEIDYTHYSTTGTWRFISGERRHPHYDAIVRMFGEDSRHPHYEYVAFEDSFPLEGADHVYSGTPAVPVSDDPAAAEAVLETPKEAEPLVLQQPQDFSDKGYLLPIDFSVGPAPKADGYTTPLSYEDSTISVQVTSANTGSCAYWYSDVKIRDASQLRTMSASRSGAFDSENAELRAETLFDRSSAVVMISGDFWGSAEKRGLGYIVRQGVLFRDSLDDGGRWDSRLMDVLILNKGIYLSSEDLLEKVWGYDSDADVGSVWVYISYLRKQLAKVGSGVTVKARRGTGYILQEPQG